MDYRDAAKIVAEEHELPYTLVYKTYLAYWKAIRQHITSLPLKEELSDDAFAQCRPNVSIPSIGKLYVTLDRYKRLKKKFKQRN